MAKDALAAHAREGLGFAEGVGAQPTLAAVASAVGAALPTLAALFATADRMVVSVPAAAMDCLAALGAVEARLRRGATRLTWGETRR